MGVSLRRKLHMRVVGVKRALHCLTKSCSRRLIGLRASPLVLFYSQLAHRCRPCGVVGDALASSKRSDKSTGFCCHLHRRWPDNAFSDRERRTTATVSCRCVAIRGSSPFIDCGFDARRTSHPVAVPRTAGTTIPHSRGHLGSGGQVHTVFRHITATVCDGPPARIQRG